MEIFSFKFLAILLVAIVILTYRSRKKRKGPVVLFGKQISISGHKLFTTVGRATPLPCLLDEGRTYGEDFKEKTPPELPHCDQCSCELVSTLQRSHEWFNKKNKSNSIFSTDLGELDRNQFRYYKYMLICNHPAATEQIRTDYQELADRIAIDTPFREKVTQHLR